MSETSLCLGRAGALGVTLALGAGGAHGMLAPATSACNAAPGRTHGCREAPAPVTQMRLTLPPALRALWGDVGALLSATPHLARERLGLPTRALAALIVLLTVVWVVVAWRVAAIHRGPEPIW